MKFCPTCQNRYDEEILRFCTKDGTPLVEENEPVFTELPSEKVDASSLAADDFGEETVIVRNTPKTETVEQTQRLSTAAPRIVIPTSEPKIERLPEPPPPVRAQTTTVYQSPPRAKSNTGKIVALTLLGTFLILGSVGVLYLMTREQNPPSPNQNVNFNNNLDLPAANFNTNFNVGNSSNFNGVGTSNISNFNSGANGKTPTPKPTPSAPSLSNANNNIGSSYATPTPKPSASPTPAETSTPTAAPTPKPSPTIPPPPPPPPPSNRPVNAGVLNGRAVNLPKPAYPPLARQMRAAGLVAVRVVIDESGNITDARATSGNIVLRAPAEAAARQSRINPVIIDNRAVKAIGILLYNFAKQ